MKPVICKFTVNPQDVHEAKVLEDLWLEAALTGVVGPVKLVKVNPPRRVAPPSGQSMCPQAHTCIPSTAEGIRLM